MGKQCAVHTHHAIVPLEKHHIFPVGMGGPDVSANLISICSNAHSAVHDYLDKLIKNHGTIPWSTRKHYGYKIRHLAQRGYDEWKQHEQTKGTQV